MKARALALLAFLSVSACRQPMAVDTSGAKFIPAAVAIDNLKELLPTALVVGCTVPKGIFQQDEVKSWKVDAEAVEFQVEKQPVFRMVFSEITKSTAERLFGGYQVRLFSPAQPDARKEHFFFNFRDEAPARRAVELIDALRVKR
jgi:hypothetical protein